MSGDSTASLRRTADGALHISQTVIHHWGTSTAVPQRDNTDAKDHVTPSSATCVEGAEDHDAEMRITSG